MKVRITENKLKKYISESIRKVINESYYGDDATPGQFVNTSREIADTFNDSQNSKYSNRRISNITVMDFIKQYGGLQKIGNLPVNQLMDMLQAYITPEPEPIDFENML